MREAEAGRLTPGLLSELLAAAGLSVPAEAPGKLALHAEEMLRWNRSIRLTAVTSPEQVAVKHIVDSLMLLRFAPFAGRTLDFGSGAGYPGIPLAVCLPESRVVLLEASSKKCAFLSHACALLALRNAETVRGRLDRRNPMPIGRYEQIVTRATLPPAEAARLLAPYLSRGARLLLMTGPANAGRPGGAEGKKEGRSRDSLPEGAVISRRLEFALPLNMGSRAILEVSVP